MKHPEEFLNRVAVYKQEQNNGELEDKKVEIDPKLINEFQKAVSKFNEKIVTAKEPTLNDDLLAQLPQTEMEENKYKFTKPQTASYSTLAEFQVDSKL